MKNFIESIKTALNDRIKNPFTGTFTLIFITTNWKAIFILFLSKKNIEYRLDLINKYYYDNIFVNYLFSIGIPLVISFLILCLLPRLNKLLENINSEVLKKRIDIKHNKEEHIYDKKIKLAEKKIKLEKSEANYREQAGFKKQNK